MTNSFEAIVEVCCHRVELQYWDFEHTLTDELKECLIEEGERCAKDLINDGCHAGELNCLYYDHEADTEEEIRGWWKIA